MATGYSITTRCPWTVAGSSYGRRGGELNVDTVMSLRLVLGAYMEYILLILSSDKRHCQVLLGAALEPLDVLGTHWKLSFAVGGRLNSFVQGNAILELENDLVNQLLEVVFEIFSSKALD